MTSEYSRAGGDDPDPRTSDVCTVDVIDVSIPATPAYLQRTSTPPRLFVIATHEDDDVYPECGRTRS